MIDATAEAIPNRASELPTVAAEHVFAFAAVDRAAEKKGAADHRRGAGRHEEGVLRVVSSVHFSPPLERPAR